MLSMLKNYMGMIAIAIVAVLVLGAIGVRIDRDQVQQVPDGIAATPAISGNAPNGLVDVRWLMQYGTQVDHIFDFSDTKQYDAGHIPGAIHVWWQDAMNLNTENYGEPDRISLGHDSDPMFGRLMLHAPQDARIILYDSQNSERASWMHWVMTVNGYTDVHVLDGGLPAWVGAGGELSTDVEDARDQSFEPTPIWNEDVQIRHEELQDRLDDPNLHLIDTRSAEEQLDTVNGTIREGHIPGSINIPTSEIMRDDGTFKSPEELRSLFETYEISPENDVVIYSLFSIQSGNMWLALQIAGYDDVSIFSEGFFAWGANEELPLATEPYSSREAIATPEIDSTPTLLPDATATPASTPVEEGPTDLTGD